MISQTTFFGIPLESRRKRRLIVVGYYAFVLLFPILVFSGVHWVAGALVSQTFILGGLLGGVRPRGPVKPFEGADSDGFSDPMLTLNLNGRARKLRLTYLDERERHRRDHAHYRAYVIVRWVLDCIVVAYWTMVNLDLKRLEPWTPVIFWTPLIFVLSLPQALILWTEPDDLGDGSINIISVSRPS